MGDMAEMMIDGTMCSVCGVYIGSDNDFPTMCDDCEKDSRQENRKAKSKSHNKRKLTRVKKNK